MFQFAHSCSFSVGPVHWCCLGMDAALVSLEVVQVGELLSAVITLVGLLSSMDALVSLEVG